MEVDECMRSQVAALLLKYVNNVWKYNYHLLYFLKRRCGFPSYEKNRDRLEADWFSFSTHIRKADSLTHLKKVHMHVICADFIVLAWRTQKKSQDFQGKLAKMSNFIKFISMFQAQNTIITTVLWKVSVTKISVYLFSIRNCLGKQ